MKLEPQQNANRSVTEAIRTQIRTPLEPQQNNYQNINRRNFMEAQQNPNRTLTEAIRTLIEHLSEARQKQSEETSEETLKPNDNLKFNQKLTPDMKVYKFNTKSDMIRKPMSDAMSL